MTLPYRKPFTVELRTPASDIARLEAVSLIFPGEDGQVGVLAGRAPLVAVLGAGRLILESAEGRREEFFLAGGFAHVRENAVTILGEQCIRTEELDPEQAWEELLSARQRPAETAEQWAARDRAVELARKKFDLAQRHRRRTMGR